MPIPFQAADIKNGSRERLRNMQHNGIRGDQEDERKRTTDDLLLTRYMTLKLMERGALGMNLRGVLEACVWRESGLSVSTDLRNQ